MLQKILELTKTHNLSHLSSVLNMHPVLEEVYRNKKADDFVVLDNGHAHLAHLVFQESDGILDANQSLTEYGIHCDRRTFCDVTTGSLGNGIGVGLGLALANKDKTVHITLSEGSCAEGSFWEALQLINEYNIQNVKLYFCFNGYSGYRRVNSAKLRDQIRFILGLEHKEQTKFFHGETPVQRGQGLQGHYNTLNEEEYALALEEAKQ